MELEVGVPTFHHAHITLEARCFLVNFIIATSAQCLQRVSERSLMIARSSLSLPSSVGRAHDSYPKSDYWAGIVWSWVRSPRRVLSSFLFPSIVGTHLLFEPTIHTSSWLGRVLLALSASGCRLTLSFISLAFKFKVVIFISMIKF